MLLVLIIQIIILKYILMEKKIEKKKGIYIYSIWMSVLMTLLLWRNFNVSTFHLEQFFTLSITMYKLSTLLSILGSLLTFSVIQVYLKMKESLLFEKQGQSKIKHILLLMILLIPIFGGSLVFFSSHWAVRSFGNLEYNQIIYMLTQSITGTEPRQVIAYLYSPVLNTAFITSIAGSLFYLLSTYKIHVLNKRKKVKYLTLSVMSLAIFLTTIGLSIHKIGYADIKAYYFEQTKIYEEHYVDSENVSLVFPDKKRNLIYIFLESLESSYASKNVGGVKSDNLIPNLTNLALEEGIHFSDTSRLGGMKSLVGAGATVSSMVAQTSGVPLIASKGSLNTNEYGDKGTEFLPGVYSLGEVLDKEGYNQVLFIGSEAEFAGKDKYFTQHGEYEIRDYNWAKEQKLIPEDYRVWWGYEDRKLFEFAKDSLVELASQEVPFNFTMLTMDTHFEDGYITEETPDLFGNQYSNVIYDNDRQVMAFVDWIKTQDFYENTTVVIVGDHLTMDTDFFENDASDYSRSIYNVFLNTPTATENQENRMFTAVDMFPTTLASLGVKIQGERLGLGTNLFSDEKTLTEKLTYNRFLEELKKNSLFYSQYIMQGTDDKLLYEAGE